MDHINGQTLLKTTNSSCERVGKYYSFQPAIHNYEFQLECEEESGGRGKTGNHIEDRLLTAGRRYEQRRQKAQIEERLKRQAAEDTALRVGAEVVQSAQQ